MQPDPLRESWDHIIEVHGADRVTKHFYSRLYRQNPGIEDLFPDDMEPQRAKLAATVRLIIAGARNGNPDGLHRLLVRLGEDHRRFGAQPDHYPAVSRALLETLEHFHERWTPQMAEAWTVAIGHAAGIMANAAAKADAAGEPLCWVAHIARVERHGDQSAWIHFDAGAYPWQPGCVVPIALAGEPLEETPDAVTVRPGSERHYTPEAIADTGQLAIHVTRAPLDDIATSLLNHHAGDRLILGAPLCPEDYP